MRIILKIVKLGAEMEGVTYILKGEVKMCKKEG